MNIMFAFFSINKTKQHLFLLNAKAILTILIAILSFQSLKAQYLHTEGTEIVDENGDEVIWRGIGLGGWMLQEGYMLRTSGPQHEIEAKIEALVGAEKKAQFYDAWLANHTRKIDIDSMASWGYNMVRLPMHYKLFTPPIEEEPIAGEITWFERGFEMTDQLLEWCKANDMYLILDMHAAPGGQGENADISDYDPTKPSLWESAANREKMVALWRKLAERYADEPMLAAYDIINEPNWGFQDHENDPNGCAESQNTLLWDLQKDITAAIREVDQNHIIVIEGNCWGNNYNGLPELWDDNLVISFHKYWNGNSQGEIQHMLNMRSDRNVPIWLGETGENSNTWFTNAISLFESNDMGWAWWPLKKLGYNNPLQIKTNPGYQKILDYWEGNGAKPNEDEAFDGLMALAENLKLENNIYHRDVVDAMIRQPHTDEPLPFKNHELKADVETIIHATDYDLGKSEFAYSDEEVTNTTGNAGGQAWNLGYTYRNDGVDIQQSEDESDGSNGYNVGWTEDGEWLKYTVDVDSGGAYNVTFRYAAPSDGSQIKLSLNGNDITQNIDLPTTGGNQSWSEVVIDDVIIDKGTQELKFHIVKGGFNFSYMSFFLSKKTEEVEFKALTAGTDENGSFIVLNLNKKIDETTLSNNLNFTLTVNGKNVEITDIKLEGDKGLKFSIDSGPEYGDEILLTYGDDELLASDGTALTNFSDLEVTNNLLYHASIPGKVEAEDFHINVGLELETTTDVGGGQNIGFTNTGDYLEYLVHVKEEGVYQVKVRIACQSQAGIIKLLQLDIERNVLNEKNVNIPVTGGWQTWQTETINMDLDAGNSILKVNIVQPEFNINWFEFVRLGTVNGLENDTQGMLIFPNPSDSKIVNVKLQGLTAHKFQQLKVLDIYGHDVRSINDISNKNEIKQIDMTGLSSGMYFITLNFNDDRIVNKLILK